MTPLTPANVRHPLAYWQIRAEERRRMVELRKDRRLILGDPVSVTFENRETVKGMAEALIYAGWIEDPQRIAEEVELFNVLIPSGGDLRATLFVAARDWQDMQLLRLPQDSLVPHVHLVFGDRSVETADELDDIGTVQTVHYVRFHVDAAEQAALCEEGRRLLSLSTIRATRRAPCSRRCSAQP